MATQKEYEVLLSLNYNDNGIVEIQATQAKLVKEQIKAFKTMGDAVSEVYQDSVEQTEAYNDAIKDNLSQLKAQDLQIKKTSKAAEIYDRALDKITDTFGNFKTQAQNGIKGLQGFVSGLSKSAQGASGFIKVLKLLRLAIIGTGIGAIVLALVGLFAAFTKTQAGANLVSQAFSGIKAVIDVVIGRVAVIGTAIIGLFRGTKTLAQATKEATGAFKGIGAEMANAAKEGARVEKVYQEIRRQSLALDVEQSRNEKRLAQLASVYEKQGVAAGTAIGLIKKASDISLDQNVKETNLAKKRLKNIEDEIKLRGKLGENDELTEARAQALIELNGLETDRIELTAKYGAELQEVRNKQRQEYLERQDQLKKLREEYAKLLNDLEGRLEKATVTGLDGIEKLLAERDAAVSELINFQKTLEEAAQKAGVKIPDATKAQIISLYADLQDTFEKEAIKFRKANPFSLETFLSFEEKTKLDAAQKFGEDVVGLLNIGQKENINDIKKLGEQLGKEVAESVAKGANDQLLSEKPIFEKIKDGLIQAFNITEEELGLAVDLIAESVAQIDDLILGTTQKQIAENEALIKSIEERVSVAQKAYDDELKLQEDGLANSAKLKEEDLKKEQTRLAQAQAEKERLDRKALNQQLLFDSLQQASALALAAVKVASAESSKGLLGILTAASGILLLFKIIAQAKANAAKVSQPPKFRGGGKFKGPSHEQGGIPVLVDNRYLVEAEGDEFVMTKKSTKVNEVFYNRINKGFYDGVNLLEAAEQARIGQTNVRNYNSMVNNSRQIAGFVQRRENEREEKMELAIDELKKELAMEIKKIVKAIEKRPVVTPLDTPYKIEFTEGNTHNSFIFRPSNE